MRYHFEKPENYSRMYGKIYICIRKDWCIMGTVIVGIIVLAIAGGAAYSLHRDKKNGKSQCGGDCSRCGGHCH